MHSQKKMKSTKEQVVETEVLIEEVDHRIETTQEEMEAFMIVKTILRQKIAIDRIYYRDAQSYFTVILDDYQ
jgi:hypothetical protein